MYINQNFFDYLRPYLVKLRNKIGSDFIVFVSAPLYLIGVVDFLGKINYLDVNVSDKSVVPSDAQEVTFHKNQDQKFYKIFIDDIEIDIGISWPGYGDFLNRIRSNPIIIEGFKFANLDIVEDWKKEMVKRYNRQKDTDYLIKIKAFREK